MGRPLTLALTATFGTQMNDITFSPFLPWPFMFQLAFANYLITTGWDDEEIMIALQNGEDEERRYIDSLSYWN